ncbi:MAG TPA: hypothetical protein VGM91_23455 [Conexibacter sp.]
MAKDYTASTVATVISTAGDATLSHSDPGHLTNGAFSLAEPLLIELAKSTRTGPTSNEKVAITFKQLVKARTRCAPGPTAGRSPSRARRPSRSRDPDPGRRREAGAGKVSTRRS